MEYNIPKVADVFPVGSHGVRRVPESLKVNKILQRSELHLYNPFDAGLPIKTVPIQQVTYKDLARSIILDSPELIDKQSKGAESLDLFNQICEMSESLWPASCEILKRLIQTPKRDDGLNLDISPDIGLVVNKPKRKIDSPSLSRRPAPPSAGGR